MPGTKERQGTLDGNAFVLKWAWQSAWIVLILFDLVPFFDLRHLFCNTFSIRLCAVALPIQLGIGPTDMEAGHCYLQMLPWVMLLRQW